MITLTEAMLERVSNQGSTASEEGRIGNVFNVGALIIANTILGFLTITIV